MSSNTVVMELIGQNMTINSVKDFERSKKTPAVDSLLSMAEGILLTNWISAIYVEREPEWDNWVQVSVRV